MNVECMDDSSPEHLSSIDEALDFFDPVIYLELNPDLIEVFGKDLRLARTHFINHGFDEGRMFRLSEKNHTRWDYKKVWNKCSKRLDYAKIAVAGHADDEKFEHSAHRTFDFLNEKIGDNKNDRFLEIGCGVGRVGSVLAKRCSHWTGADVSSEMIKHAEFYLQDLDNITLLETSGFDLDILDDQSFSKVYCIVVFMHLDEWERYNYIKESYRVLQSGGKLLVNNINLCSEDGWNFFEEHLKIKPQERPLNISKTSTAQELCQYFTMAGFKDIETHFKNLWVTVTARKG